MSTYRTIFQIFTNFLNTEEINEVEKRTRRRRKTTGLSPDDTGLADTQVGMSPEDSEIWGDLWSTVNKKAENDPVATDDERKQIANLAVAHAILKDMPPEEYEEEFVSAPAPRMNDFTSQPGTVAGYIDSLKAILSSSEEEPVSVDSDLPIEDEPSVSDIDAVEPETPSRVSIQNDILDPLSKFYPGVYDYYSNLMQMKGKKVVEPDGDTISTKDLAAIIGKVASPEDTQKIVKLAKNKKIVAEQALKTYIEIILEKALRERNKNT